MKATANEEPERLVLGPGKAQYNYNIKQVTVEESDGSTRTAYEYDYEEIVGKITKAKIIKALEDSKLGLSVPCDLEELETDYNAATSAIENSYLANITYSQLDTFIEDNVTNMASAKQYLKKLSKVVLALLKYQNVI